MWNLKEMSCSNWSALTNRLNLLLIGASLSLGAIAIATPVNAETQKPSSPDVTASTLPDGVYLYGQSAKPDQLGQGYFVFEAKDGKVVGALYMPRSSFDCAAGTFQKDQLALTVTNSYDRTTNPFDIALQPSSTVASGSNAPMRETGLQGFHKLDTISENDQRILKVCKADLQGVAQK